MVDKNQMHYITVTVILVKDGKYLVAKRASWEKAFPSRWTVPGGKLEVLDYALREKDTAHHWYNVFEDCARRECEEEVGIKIKNIGYVTSMVYVRPDGVPCTIVSLFAEPDNEDVKLCNALTEYAWVNLEEAKGIDLIDGIYDELKILEEFLGARTADGSDGIVNEWKKEEVLE